MYSQNDSFNVPASTRVERGKPASSSAASFKTRRKWHQRWWGRLILIFLVIFFVLLIALGFYVGRVVVLLRTGQLTPAQLFGGDFSAGQLQSLPTLATADDPSLGPKDAKVVMVEFSDFQCPFCRQAMPVIKEILKDYGDQILFVYRDFPITETHPQAVLAALAGECAHEQGNFWAMHDKIFENQDQISEVNLKIWAIQIGLNSLQFGNCLSSGKYLSEIEQDFQEGVAAGVAATPTFFINGQAVRGALPLATFEQIIIAELSR